MTSVNLPDGEFFVRSIFWSLPSDELVLSPVTLTLGNCSTRADCFGGRLKGPTVCIVTPILLLHHRQDVPSEISVVAFLHRDVY